MACLLGDDLGLEVNSYFEKYGLKNPAVFVVNLWLEWIYRNYPESSRINPAKNDDYFNNVKYPVLENMVVPEWKKQSKGAVLEMLGGQDSLFYMLSEESDSKINLAYAQLMSLAENKFLELQGSYQKYIEIYGSNFTFYSYGVEDAAFMIFNCFEEDIKMEDGLKMLCSTVKHGFAENGLPEQDSLFYVYGAKHSFDLFSKHMSYRHDTL